MDIGSFYNVSSKVIRNAAENSSLKDIGTHTGEFATIFDKAIENLETTNSYLSDAENEEIKLAMGQAEAIVVPYQSVQKLTGSNDRYIFLDKDGVAKRVFVQLGQRFDQDIEIISDEIAEGDRIVTVGQAKLVDGSKLNVVKEN